MVRAETALHENGYARFDTHSYYSCIETHFNAWDDVKLRQSLKRKM